MGTPFTQYGPAQAGHPLIELYRQLGPVLFYLFLVLPAFLRKQRFCADGPEIECSFQKRFEFG
jgi:hypothetical protein